LKILGGTSSIKRRKPLVHRLILNDQTFLSPHMTSIINENSPYSSNLFSDLTCSTSSCLRNQTLVKTNDLLQLNTYSLESGYINYLNPIESPFPFFHLLSDTKDPLRTKFYHQTNELLPENLRILLTISSSINHSLINSIHSSYSNRNNIINYAYTKWNLKNHDYHFDESLYNYHRYILAPLLQYAKYTSNNRQIVLVEKYFNRYQSELPFTMGYVLAPSMSVFNETYVNANENEKIESMKMMNLFANLIHNG